MNELMYMQYKCLACGKWFKKSHRRDHEQKFNHNIEGKGTIVRPVETELKALIDRISVPKKEFKKDSKALARELYPSLYLLMDTIRGSMLQPQR